jgi:hypothetical protein
MIKRRGNDDTNISFLDVISCGFGAIVLLLVIVQTQSPEVIEAADTDQSASVRALQEELFALRGEIDFLDRELNAKHEQLGIEDELVAILLDQLEVSEKRLFALNEENTAAEGPRGELQLALQSLTEEMRRLYSNYQNETNYIGGIPVDSEYIIFVIDTSGSMFTYSWPRMIQELTDILDVYPSVKGIQIMNDMGQYMFTSFRGQWIPDTSDRREIIVSQLRNWHPFSNSSPVEGIQAAIQTFYQSDHKISIYVLGDDYTGRSLEAVLDAVYNLNRQSGSSEPMVRIHAIGFPLMLAVGEADAAARFAALMREIAQQNLGSFVGLNDFR